MDYYENHIVGRFQCERMYRNPGVLARPPCPRAGNQGLLALGCEPSALREFMNVLHLYTCLSFTRLVATYGASIGNWAERERSAFGGPHDLCQRAHCSRCRQPCDGNARLAPALCGF